MKLPINLVGIFGATAILCSTGTAFAGPSEPRLWLIDGGEEKNYEITVNGGVTVNSTFPVVFNAKSSIAVDPFDRTLWGAAETKVGYVGGAVVNYSRTGALLSAIEAADFGGLALEGVAADYFSDTLWVVDDPVGVVSGKDPTVYNIEKDGTLISSFSTFSFDSDAGSPQSIAVDPFDGTLWLTNNSPLNDRIYHVERDGDLIASFASDTYDVGANNPQGITVDESNHTLWVTDRASDLIYNITTSGDLISSFHASAFDTNATNVVAVAYDSGKTWPVVSEPTTAAIFGLGLIGLGYMRRRFA